MVIGTLTLLRDAALGLLFPPRCEVCRMLQEPLLCARCRAQFAPIDAPICRTCGLPLDPLAKTVGYCTACNDEPPPFDAARAAGYYSETLRRAIHVFKYEMVRALANPLGDFIAENLSLPFPIDGLCPVPLHPARERMRGFNQSQLLAECLGRHWHVPLVPDALLRTQNTTPQMLLPHDQRLHNVRGAFSAGPAPVAGRTLGLVDDVYTTGATLRECSRVLKRAGAARVLVITLARAIQR